MHARAARLTVPVLARSDHGACRPHQHDAHARAGVGVLLLGVLAGRRRARAGLPAAGGGAHAPVGRLCVRGLPGRRPGGQRPAHQRLHLLCGHAHGRLHVRAALS